MKKIFTVIVALAAFLAAESTADAQLLKNLFKKSTTTTTETAAATTTAATTNGQAAGAALKALYTQYKADGKVDMSNLSNLANLATLASNVQGLKGQTDKSTFYKEFASGLVLGSGNLVTANNSTSVMSGLSNLVNNVDLSSLTSKASSLSEKVSSTVSTASEKTSTAVDNATNIANSVTNILNLFKK